MKKQNYIEEMKKVQATLRASRAKLEKAEKKMADMWNSVQKDKDNRDLLDPVDQVHYGVCEARGKLYDAIQELTVQILKAE